ncbi:MAG TPA: PQQ-binding-like beta-propeller repeat protein [Ktedonobacterales bacterium]
MNRYPGDTTGNPPGPHGQQDARDPFSAPSPVADNARSGYSQPYGPLGQGGAIQPPQPIRAPRPEPANENTTPIPDRNQYQLAPGTRLGDGRYIIEGVVGKGGMGHVYRAVDTRLNRVRAIKEMIPQMGDPEAGLTNYSREVQVMLELENESKSHAIPQVYDTFIEGRRAYIVLQFIEGENLEQRLEHTPGFLTQEQVGDWMLQLCDIVSYLHAHHPPVIFRDIKPNNIILTPDNRIVLIDFGIAKSFYEGEEHTNVGTNGYAAKEQYMRQAEPRSDIYSIGATMHHLLTRSDPRAFAPFTFAERMPRTLNPAISEAMQDVIMKAVAVEKENRYQTCDDLARAIESALGLTPVADTGVYRVTRPPASQRPTTWKPAVGPTGTLIGPELLWAFTTGDEVRATPLLTPDTVYVGSYDNTFYALDRRTGGLRWKFMTGGGICGRAAIWHDLVIIGSEDASIYALNANTGAQVWRQPTGRQVRSSPRVFNDAVYIGSDDGSMYALDPRSGSPLWRYTTFREVVSSPAHARGNLFFGSRDGYVYALDAISGEKKWAFRTNAEVISTPWVDGDFVYIGSTDFGVYCLDAKSGWKAWEERTEKFVISSPVIAGEYLYIGSTDHHLYCLNKRTGRRMWRYRAGNQINSTPFVAGDVVYFGCIDRSIYGLDTTTGNLRWRFVTDGIVPGSPVIDQGTLYVGSVDHNVYAARATTP